MTPDPKLVEALADLYARFSGWETVNERERGFAAHVIDTLRLVQLPEEPDGWTDSGWASSFGGPNLPFIRVFKDTQPWIDNVPVYIIPGDPLEVDEKEYRARVYGEFPPEEAPDA